MQVRQELAAAVQQVAWAAGGKFANLQETEGDTMSTVQLANRARSLLRCSAGFPDSGFYLDLDIFTPLKHFVVAPAGQN